MLLRLLASALVTLLVGCASLPREVTRIPSTALRDTADTRLGRGLAGALAANPGRTGVHLLRDGRDAFAARILLARAAERSLDVQYYIWRGDTTGGLLCQALWQAAERGVRVRMLVDDGNTRGMDEAFAALDAHPNIEVRLFNPWANRQARILGLAGDFARLNRRMHNKSFTADNQATIVGGRNVGDEYFGGASPVSFADLDALAAGAVVPEVSSAFDAYWNSASAYPAASILPPAAADSAGRVRAAWERLDADPEATAYVEAVRELPIVRELLAGRLALEWAPARLVSDDVAKVLHPPDQSQLHMLPRLVAALGEPRRELDLVSPYFVPTKAGAAALAAIAARGVKIRILTNSLAATDVAPVHAGYAKYREELLRAGIRLYELKPSAHRDERRGGGSSDASLHAKTFAVDRERLFVGSFNFDPRSARLNTEMGLVLSSPRLAARISEALDAHLASEAWEVRLEEGQLVWIDGAGRQLTEPGTGWLRRLWVGFLALLPFEWLL